MNPALAKIRADLARHRKLFDLTEGDLGEDLCKAATDGVADAIAREESPDGTPWDQLDPEYEAWKAAHFPGNGIGFLHGTMADPDEIAGEVDVTPEEAVVTFGKTDQARDEAAWFQEGDEDDNRPPRPFWGFTAESVAAARSILDRRFSTIR